MVEHREIVEYRAAGNTELCPSVSASASEWAFIMPKIYLNLLLLLVVYKL